MLIWCEAGSRADVAQLVERVLGKDEVTSSILVIGSILTIKPRQNSDSSDLLNFDAFGVRFSRRAKLDCSSRCVLEIHLSAIPVVGDLFV